MLQHHMTFKSAPKPTRNAAVRAGGVKLIATDVDGCVPCACYGHHSALHSVYASHNCSTSTSLRPGPLALLMCSPPRCPQDPPQQSAAAVNRGGGSGEGGSACRRTGEQQDARCNPIALLHTNLHVQHHAAPVRHPTPTCTAATGSRQHCAITTIPAAPLHHHRTC